MDDTTEVRGHLKARSVDLLVCDLPYGVQHGSTAPAAGLQRGPDDLLRRRAARLARGAAAGRRGWRWRGTGAPSSAPGWPSCW